MTPITTEEANGEKSTSQLIKFIKICSRAETLGIQLSVVRGDNTISDSLPNLIEGVIDELEELLDDVKGDG